MNRRAFLTSISVGTATVAGCIGRNENNKNERKYEECNQRVIHYGSLPEDVKAEVDTAFDEGQYESDGELLWQQVAGPRVEWLLHGGTYYTPQVDVDNGVRTLQFRDTTPQYDSMKYLHIRDVPEIPLDILITVRNSNGAVLEEVNTTIEDRAFDRRPKIPVASEFGTYIIEVTVEDWGTVTEELALHPNYNTMLLEIDKEKEKKPSFSEFITIDPNADKTICSWEQSSQ